MKGNSQLLPAAQRSSRRAPPVATATVNSAGGRLQFHLGRGRGEAATGPHLRRPLQTESAPPRSGEMGLETPPTSAPRLPQAWWGRSGAERGGTAVRDLRAAGRFSAGGSRWVPSQRSRRGLKGPQPGSWAVKQRPFGSLRAPLPSQGSKGLWGRRFWSLQPSLREGSSDGTFKAQPHLPCL